MYCKKCGTMISEEVKYCSSCGCLVGKATRKSNANEEVKKINVGMLGIAIVTFIVMMLTLLDVIPSIKDLGVNGATNSKTVENDEFVVLNTLDEENAKEKDILDLSKKEDIMIEGGGYESPEENIKAYIAALNKGDVDEVLSTFAIESFVDNFDTRAEIERFTVFMPDAPFNKAYELSDGSDFDRDIRIKVRQAAIIRRFYSMISQLTVHHDGCTISLEGEEVDVFMNNINESDFLNAWKNMKYIEMISPEKICDVYYSEPNQNNIELQRKIYCCEDIEDVCALVEIGGEEYYQFAQCGKYNGRWYIIDCAGNLSSLFTADRYLYGLVPCSDIE